MNKIKVVKGSVIIECDRNDFVGVDPIPDGVVFNFKNGMFLHVTDTSMPTFTKDMMKNAGNSFQKGNLKFDLVNYRVPTTLELF